MTKFDKLELCNSGKSLKYCQKLSSTSVDLFTDLVLRRIRLSNRLFHTGGSLYLPPSALRRFVGSDINGPFYIFQTICDQPTGSDCLCFVCKLKDAAG